MRAFSSAVRVGKLGRIRLRDRQIPSGQLCFTNPHSRERFPGCVHGRCFCGILSDTATLLTISAVDVIELASGISF